MSTIKYDRTARWDIDHQLQALGRSLDGHETCTRCRRARENEPRNDHLKSGVINGGGSVKIKLLSSNGIKRSLCIGLLCSVRSGVLAADVDFVNDVRPILQKHCYSCHSQQKQKSSFRLDLKAAAFRGGELYDDIIVPGHASDSLLIQFVANDDADLVMPPDGDRLSAAEVATLARWVDEGAVWPAGVDQVFVTSPRDHWSFRKPAGQIPPETENSTWPRTAIDRFILSRLEQEGLRPAPESGRVAWLRRVSFDLIGLPPTPDQMSRFLSDTRDTAYEEVVDELLKSPRYGERWAQHWLDVVRYADTHGFEVNTERPHAWPYRDYVIRSFNNDTAYDQFIREQIVGDAMGQDAATGFLVTASVLLPGQIGQDAPSMRLARQDSLDEIVVNIGQTFLGLSIGCARCHDHKFDPISQEDYYSMQAFVAGVEYKDRALRTKDSEEIRQQMGRAKSRIAEIEHELSSLLPLARVNTPRDELSAQRVRERDAPLLRSSVNPRVNTDRFAPVMASRLRFTVLQTVENNRREPCIDELEVFNLQGKNVALAAAGATVASAGDNVTADRHELRFVHDGDYGNSRSWMSNAKGRGQVTFTFAEPQTIDRVVWGRDRVGKYSDRLAVDYQIEVAGSSDDWQVVANARDRAPFNPTTDHPKDVLEGLSESDRKSAQTLLDERTRLQSVVGRQASELKVFAGQFREPDQIHLLTRGNPEQPRHAVVPAVPALFDGLSLPAETAEQQRRSALAEWIASPEHPLTARVMVNRIWQWHFGVGLVETANDFGRSGQQPTHPELLDWLAHEFVKSGWSMKSMHRLICLSATYRQATRHSNESQQQAASQDADARLLWRYPTRRIEGETIRDSMLAVSGELDLGMYGRGYNLFNNRGGLTGFEPIEHFERQGLRRMIYAHKVRRERDGVFGAFDCPDAGQSTPRRRESTTPVQALNLFNSTFTLERAAALATRAKSDNDDISQQIQRVYRITLSRDPDADELREAEAVVLQHGLETLCRVIFNCNEFLFLP